MCVYTYILSVSPRRVEDRHEAISCFWPPWSLLLLPLCPFSFDVVERILLFFFGEFFSRCRRWRIFLLSSLLFSLRLSHRLISSLLSLSLSFSSTLLRFLPSSSSINYIHKRRCWTASMYAYVCVCITSIHLYKMKPRCGETFLHSSFLSLSSHLVDGHRLVYSTIMRECEKDKTHAHTHTSILLSVSFDLDVFVYIIDVLDVKFLSSMINNLINKYF